MIKTVALVVLLTIAQDRPRVSTEALEARIFDLVNAERTQQNLKSLKVDPKLTEIARAHSGDMARRRFFDHVNPDGRSPSARGRAGGVPCRKSYIGYSTYGIAENIFQNNLYDRVIIEKGKATYEWNSLEDIATSTVKGWMNSDGHRRVILTDRYRTSGIGIAIAANDQVLITQEFC